MVGKTAQVNRATRLGELSPIVYFVQFMEMTKVAQFWGNFLPRLRLRIIFDGKCIIGLHFGHFFSQTHLVTLQVIQNLTDVDP
jgi:hypothetical protein